MTTAPKKQVDERAEGMPEEEGMTARLTAPLLTFDLAAEIEQLKGEEHWQKDGRVSKDFGEALRFQNRADVMKAGTLMQEPKTDAGISIHALSDDCSSNRQANRRTRRGIYWSLRRDLSHESKPSRRVLSCSRFRGRTDLTGRPGKRPQSAYPFTEGKFDLSSFSGGRQMGKIGPCFPRRERHSR